MLPCGTFWLMFKIDKENKAKIWAVNSRKFIRKMTLKYFAKIAVLAWVF